MSFYHYLVENVKVLGSVFYDDWQFFAVFFACWAVFAIIACISDETGCEWFDELKDCSKSQNQNVATGYRIIDVSIYHQKENEFNSKRKLLTS